MPVYPGGDTAQDLQLTNTKATQCMAYGKREGYAEKEPKRGEYSTISGYNIVWMNVGK